MKKKLFTLLTLLLCLCSGAWADETSKINLNYSLFDGLSDETTVSSETTYSGTYTQDEKNFGISVTLSAGKIKNGLIQITSGGNNATLTITAPAGYVMTKIVGTFSSNKVNTVTTTPTNSSEIAATSTTYTWEGSSNSMTFNLTSASSTNTEFKSIVITYSASSTTYSVTHSLTNVTASSGATGASAATAGTAYNAVFAASSGYSLPETIGVTIGGTAATAGTDYTWNSSTGAFTVPAAKVTGAIVVTIAGVAVQTNEVTATWAFSTGAAGQAATIDTENVFSTNYVEVAKMTYEGVASDQDVVGTKMQPIQSASDDKSEYVKFTLMPKEGMTFVPTHIEFDAMRWGTDGSNKLHYYAESGTTNQELGNVNPNRNGKNNGWSHYSQDITTHMEATKENPFSLALYVYGLASNKQISFANVVITGTYSGTPSEETMCTVSTEVNPSNAGIIYSTKPAASLPNGVSVTFSVLPNTGYRFLNKWIVNNNEETGETYTIESLANNTTVVAQFVQQKAITYEANGGTGVLPATDYIDPNESYIISTPFFLWKEGCSFAGWNDGNGHTYNSGDEIASVVDNITLTAQWNENTVNLGDVCTTVNWTFAKNEGAPTISFEGTEGNKYVQQVSIGGTTFDAIMDVNTKKSAAINNKTGKLNNASYTDKAQCNEGTLFTIPAVNGMVVKYIATENIAKTEIGFTDNGSELGTLTNADNSTNNILTYKYNGNANSLYIVVKASNKNPKGITVTYPGEGEELISTLSGRNYATYITGSNKLDFSAAEGITAYIAKNLNSTSDAVIIQPVDIVPTNTPIIVKTATKGATVNVPVTTADASDVSGNNLVAGDGLTAWDGTTGYTYYYLASDEFHKGTSGTLQAGKAYLKLAGDPTSAKAMTLFIGEGETTAINGIEDVAPATMKTRKVVKNGRLVIETANGEFTIDGARVK